MRCVAYLIVGPGEADRWLEAALRQLHWCDQVAVCLNNADGKTAAMAKKYANIIETDDREWGKNQWRIKQDFLSKVLAAQVEVDDLWFVGLDADEILDSRFDRALAEKMSSGKDVAWYFWCLQLYGDENTVRPDLCFPNVRFWKYLPELGLDFQPTPLHCGLAPRYSYQFGSQSGLWFRHYGLMLKADRERKVARYEKYDPQGKYKAQSWYRGLKNDSPRTVPFGEYVKKLPDFIYRAKSPTLRMKRKNRDIIWFRNRHGRPFPAVGELQIAQARNQGYQELPGLKVGARVEAPVIEAPKSPFSEPVPPGPLSPSGDALAARNVKPARAKRARRPKAVKETPAEV